MKSNYKPIGNYIRKVENRNKDLKVSRLLGLSMTKEFRETTSNIVGTDMSVYKVMSKYQFACDFMSPIRVNKLPVVLKLDDEPNIVSPAYPVFEIKDRNELDPEYLMMWFRRPEFDRYATFKCDAAIRGGYEWEELCETLIPIPLISKQKEIVKEYNVIQNRIGLNQKLIQKLEETAQAIYKHWFVNFEFPDENGKSYKSNGGEMVWNEEMGKEIPKGWEVKPIGDITSINAGGDKPKIFSETKTEICQIPIYSNGVTNNGLYGFTNKNNYTKNSITISARGTIGFCVLRNEDFDAIVRLLVLIPKISYTEIYLWQNLRKIEFDNSGSVQNQLTIPQISVIKIIMPHQEVLNKYHFPLSLIYQNMEIKYKENLKILDLKDLLLSKLSTIEK